MGARGATWGRALVVTVVGSSGALGACSSTQPSDAPAEASGSNGLAGIGGASASAGTAAAASNGGGTATSGAPTASAGTAGAPAANAGASANAAGTTSAGGSVANDPACPRSIAEVFAQAGPPACATAGLSCSLPAACSSGNAQLGVTCRDGKWQLGALGCDKPYDFCAESIGANGPTGPTAYCEGGQWAVDVLQRADGTGPCPGALPDGDPCSRGGSTGGSSREHCGYRCASDPSKWTVVSCVDPGVYRADGACK